MVFLFPPYPKMAVPPADIPQYDDGTYVAQLKLDGCCGLLNWTPTEHVIYERSDGTPLSKAKPLPYSQLFNKTVKSTIVVGEYMVRNRMGFDGKPFNHKYCVHDILMLNGALLYGQTLLSRRSLLRSVLNISGPSVNYLTPVGQSGEFYMIDDIPISFADIFTQVTKTDMVEGIIVKRKNAKLERCNKKDNNTGWQFKFRKPNNNYKF
jgi:ATP-dependent DNA ligase